MNEKTRDTRTVSIPLPTDTYAIARKEAEASGLPVGTKIRTDMISYYNGVARRRARTQKKGST